MITWMTISTLT